MAIMSFSNVAVIASFVCLLGATRSSAEINKLAACQFDAIYQFGDSISDTGNIVVEVPKDNMYLSFPYGISINEATGRASDGLLMIDYIAQSAGLPLLEPYEKHLPAADFRHGVNFAVSGVTALDVAFLAAMNLTSEGANSSLNVQLGWFDTYLNSLCGKGKGKCGWEQKFKSALFMLGEFGINDYNYAFSKGMSLKEAKQVLVPNVVNVITRAAKTLIDRGAVRVVVPGIFPMGCLPTYLQFMKSKYPGYDRYGCLKDFNDFTAYHNANLQKALKNLGKNHPAVRIVYGDLYKAFLSVWDNSSRLGILQLTKACCGAGGGQYNVDAKVHCGNKDHTVCTNPNEYISWDGVHLTQQTYEHMANWLIRKTFSKLGCKKL